MCSATKRPSEPPFVFNRNSCSWRWADTEFQQSNHVSSPAASYARSCEISCPSGFVHPCPASFTEHGVESWRLFQGVARVDEWPFGFFHVAAPTLFIDNAVNSVDAPRDSCPRFSTYQLGTLLLCSLGCRVSLPPGSRNPACHQVACFFDSFCVR